jgi:thiosulfate/3-mercaptopyruvate sulfurtransferase
MSASYFLRSCFAVCLLSLSLGLTCAAQEPVLFDGSGPVVFGFQAAPTDDAIPATQRVTPDELAKTLQSAGAQKPLLFEVGPRSLYLQAHIPGSEYLGATSSDSGRKQLRQHVKALPHNTPIVLYCGCCPWRHCPNVYPAYQELHVLGFTSVKVLYIADNFGTDWVDKGYPTAKGE